MTRYDPFSYGQLPLDGKGATPSSPDDILFDPAASPQPTSRPAIARGKAQANPWEAAANDGFGDLLAPGAGQSPAQLDANAMAFGAEVLGEVAEEPANDAAPAARPKPKATAAAAAAAPASATPPKPKQQLPRRVMAPLPLPLRRRSAVASTIGALTIGGGGLAGAGWLLMDQHNPILAAIAAAASLVAGAIAWVLLRR
jgi:hypothetical protein